MKAFYQYVFLITAGTLLKLGQLNASVVINLPKEVNVNSHQVNLSTLCTNFKAINYTITVRKSKILSSSEIATILRPFAHEPLIFIGAETKLNFFTSLSVEQAVSNILPKNFILNQKTTLKNPVFIQKYQLLQNPSNSFLHISGLEFQNSIGHPFSATLFILHKASNSVQPKKTQEESYRILKKDNRTLLFYQKGNLSISTPIHILRTIDSNRFLVENKESGKRWIINASVSTNMSGF